MEKFRKLLVSASGSALLIGAFVPVGSAEIICETKTQTCMDARLGPRLCHVTICKDELGNITHTDIIVLKDGSSQDQPKAKLPVTRVPTAGIKQ